jgi:hypothetical protein
MFGILKGRNSTHFSVSEKINCKSSLAQNWKNKKKTLVPNDVIWLWDWWQRSVELGCALVQSRSNKSWIQEFHQLSWSGISSIPGSYQTCDHVWVYYAGYAILIFFMKEIQ